MLKKYPECSFFYFSTHGCIKLSHFWFPPPFDFFPREASHHVSKSIIFFPIRQWNSVGKVWILVNCVLIISICDLVLPQVIFSPNFLFFSFSPFDFLPHLQTYRVINLNWQKVLSFYCYVHYLTNLETPVSWSTMFDIFCVQIS